MSKHPWMVLGGVVLAAALANTPVLAQTPAHDPSTRLRAVLPAEVADRVLATIADARARALPAAALEHRALELAAKGVKPGDIETDVNRHAQGLEKAHAALTRGGRTRPGADETEAAADAMNKGVDGRAVSDLARMAPADRPIAVPIYVLSSLLANGYGIETALASVQADLAAGIPDNELARGADRRPAGRGPGMRPVAPPVSTPGAGRIPVPPVREDLPEVPPSNPGLRP